MANEEIISPASGVHQIEVADNGEQPPEEAAEGLGEVALGSRDPNNEQFGNPRENKDLAQEMAGAEAPLRNMIENIRESNLPNKDALVETLEKDIDNITEQAKEKYLEAERKYKTVRDLAVGNIMLVLRGEVAPEAYGPIVSIDNLSHMGGKAELGEGEESNLFLTAEQVERLREEIYTLFGAKPPNIFTDETGSDDTRYSWAKVEGNVKVPGRKIVERRNAQKGQLYPRMTIGFEGS